MVANAVAGPGPSPWWFQSPRRPSLFLEQRAGVELAELFMNPVYYGIGVPHGAGTPVLLLPGFLGSDGYLSIMSSWLRRTGYRPYSSGFTIVAGSPFDMIARVLRRAEQIAAESRRPVTVIGHSLGGMLACVLARLRPDLVTHVITMGSPLCEDPRTASHPLVAALADLLVREGRAPRNAVVTAREFERQLFTGPMPENVRLTCIFTREDAVVDWRACTDGDPRTTAHEVRGTHVGLAWNAQVYGHVGRALPLR